MAKIVLDFLLFLRKSKNKVFEYCSEDHEEPELTRAFVRIRQGRAYVLLQQHDTFVGNISCNL